MNGSEQAYPSPDQSGPQELPVAAPPVVVWFRVYCGLMAFLYLMNIAGGAVLLVMRDRIARHLQGQTVDLAVQGALCVVIGIVFVVPFSVSFFLPRKKWVWIYDLVLICLGLANCCCIPACIPLLIFWLKPEVKAYFGMQS